MSLQTIIDNATYIDMDIREQAGSTLSRSGHYKTADRNVNIYSFKIGMHEGLTYSTNRGIIQDIYTTGTTNEANISLNNNSGMEYLTAYQGDITPAELNNVVLNNISGSTIYIDTTSVSGSGNIFKKGDYIQPASGYRYPYQVTADVAHTTSSSVSIPLSRPFIPQDSYTLSGKGIVVGSACTWKVKMLTKPKYSVIPGDLLEFDNDFEFLEFIRKEDG